MHSAIPPSPGAQLIYALVKYDNVKSPELVVLSPTPRSCYTLFVEQNGLNQTATFFHSLVREELSYCMDTERYFR